MLIYFSPFNESGRAPRGGGLQIPVVAAAVAVLKEIPLIILASGRKAPRDLEERCAAENICVACVAESIFGTCRKLSELGIEG